MRTLVDIPKSKVIQKPKPKAKLKKQKPKETFFMKSKKGRKIQQKNLLKAYENAVRKAHVTEYQVQPLRKEMLEDYKKEK